MPKTNPLVEMPEPIEVPVTKKKFSIPKAVGITLTVAMLGLSLLHTASAMFTDKGLEALEANYRRALLAYHHQQSLEKDSVKAVDVAVAHREEMKEQTKLMADLLCDAWKPLPAYKKSKGIKRESDENVCITVKAPQEVGYQPYVVPGAEGQVLPDPAFQQ